MRFELDRASLIGGSKLTIFALFYFVLEGNFPSTSPRGAYIWRGDLTEDFVRYRFWGLIFGGAYTWRGLFSKFYGISFLSVLLVLPVVVKKPPSHKVIVSSREFKKETKKSSRNSL